MSSLSHAPGNANAYRIAPEPASFRRRCTGHPYDTLGRRCCVVRPHDLSDWCDECLDELLANISCGADDFGNFLRSEDSMLYLARELPHLFPTPSPLRVASGPAPAVATAPATPPAEGIDDLAAWLDRQAAMYRVGSSEASSWLARRIEELATEARLLGARTPGEFEAREQAMMDDAADAAYEADLADGWDF